MWQFVAERLLSHGWVASTRRPFASQSPGMLERSTHLAVVVSAVVVQRDEIPINSHHRVCPKLASCIADVYARLLMRSRSQTAAQSSILAVRGNLMAGRAWHSTSWQRCQSLRPAGSTERGALRVQEQCWVFELHVRTLLDVQRADRDAAAIRVQQGTPASHLGCNEVLYASVASHAVSNMPLLALVGCDTAGGAWCELADPCDPDARTGPKMSRYAI